MTSRQRILAAMEHRESDRVPVDLGAMPSSGISAIAYNKLVKHLDLEVGPAKVYDVVQQLAQPDDRVLARHILECIPAAFRRENSLLAPSPLAEGIDGTYSVLRIFRTLFRTGLLKLRSPLSNCLSRSFDLGLVLTFWYSFTYSISSFSPDVLSYMGHSPLLLFQT